MASYTLDFPDIGPVTVTKKRGMRSLRLRISPKGEVLVSTPWSVPKPIVSAFVKERKKWILDNTDSHPITYRSGMTIGKNTKLYISELNARNRSSVTPDGLMIDLAGKFDAENHTQQAYIEKKIIQAMQVEAENELLPRLDELARQTGHTFNQAYIKRLSSRWGSCDQDKNIILNVFLLQIPEKLQDYVMLHELTHTIYMNHSPEFWRHMEDLMPSVKLYRKLIKKYRPRIEPR